jgi:hypothetical protein
MRVTGHDRYSIEHNRDGTVRAMLEIRADDRFSAESRIEDVDTPSRV